MAKPLDTALTVTGTAKLGRDLIEAALETNRTDTQKKVVDSVKKLLVAIDEQNKIIDSAKRAIAVYNTRLDAIQSGKFTISRDGELVLNDDKLAPLGLNR